MVEAGTFRADLFYRLNVFPIHVPALRERPEDIPLLVRHFVQQLGRRMNKVVETIPAETMTALSRYDWPGNIRELQNLVERSMILTTGPVLRIPLDELKAHGAPAAGNSRPRTLQEAEREHVLATLEETHWVLGGKNGAAARLGDEPLHAPVPDEEAGDRPTGTVTRAPRTGAFRDPIAVPARWRLPTRWRQNTGTVRPGETLSRHA